MTAPLVAKLLRTFFFELLSFPLAAICTEWFKGFRPAAFAVRICTADLEQRQPRLFGDLQLAMIFRCVRLDPAASDGGPFCGVNKMGKLSVAQHPGGHCAAVGEWAKPHRPGPVSVGVGENSGESPDYFDDLDLLDIWGLLVEPFWTPYRARYLIIFWDPQVQWRGTELNLLRSREVPISSWLSGRIKGMPRSAQWLISSGRAKLSDTPDTPPLAPCFLHRATFFDTTALA